jgi:microcystin-dependent protein
MSSPFIAEIVMFGGNFAPRGWAFCDGQLLAISSNTALFSLLGTTYGGDGRTTFGLPDLRGRVALGPRNGPGLSNYNLGQKGGVQGNVLTQAQMAAGFPSLATHGGTADKVSPVGNHLAEPVDGTGNALAGYNSTGEGGALAGMSTGAGSNVENRQPYIGINYIIALVGVFPSRN